MLNQRSASPSSLKRRGTTAKSLGPEIVLPSEALASPFLKWAGGKSQLLAALAPYFPEKFGTYYEPFVGGGAVFFHLHRTRPHMKAVISDCNEELVNAYTMVRENPSAIIKALGNHRNDPEHFYEVRAQDTSKLTPVARAARLIFLNKTCFNGLYRVNRSGAFNVPFGKYKNPKFADANHISAVSAALRNTDILCQPFEETVRRARRGDLIYMDPPYQPLSTTSSFTGYTKSSFKLNDQERLAEMFTALDKRGCHLVMSNSDTEQIRHLYREFRIDTVLASRAINSKSTGRGKITELVITNR